MMKKVFLSLCLIMIVLTAGAQDKRAQYPKILSNAYFGLDIGYINYPFGNEHLKPGFTAGSVHIPQPAVRLTLFGYRFNENISARFETEAAFQRLSPDYAGHCSCVSGDR